MKTRAFAPAIGLVLTLLAAGCGSGGDATPAQQDLQRDVQDSSHDDSQPLPSPPAAANSVARVKAAMTERNEADSPALQPGTDPISDAPIRRAVTPGPNDALGGFGQVLVADGNAGTNTRVQIRNLETFVYAAGQWSRVQLGHRVFGAVFPANYAGAGTWMAFRPESSGGVSIRPVTDSVIQFWPESGVTQSLLPARTTIEAVFTTVQARLIRDAANGPDDRGSARILVNTAAAWWATPYPVTSSLFLDGILAGIRNSSGATARFIGAGRLALATPDWQAMNFHYATGSQSTTQIDRRIDELARPLPGGVAPISNSSALAPRPVTRIMPLGDSITQGRQDNQDSYRRVLWNKLVSDLSLPIVDFVGTRSGAFEQTGSCSDEADEAGAYARPEFDLQHEAYWGRCIEQVSDRMPDVLRQLASNGETPDIALVHLGTNDITQQGQSGAAIRGELVTLANRLKAANARMSVLLAKLIPIGTRGLNWESGSAGLVPGVNAEIGQIPGSVAGVTVVDQHGGYDPAIDSYDDLHPGPSGEEKMAQRWLAAIRPLLAPLP